MDGEPSQGSWMHPVRGHKRAEAAAAKLVIHFLPTSVEKHLVPLDPLIIQVMDCFQTYQTIFPLV